MASIAAQGDHQQGHHCLVNFRPYTFSSFDTFRCPRQYRLSNRVVSSSAPRTSTRNEATDRGCKFERDVIDALKKGPTPTSPSTSLSAFPSPLAHLLYPTHAVQVVSEAPQLEVGPLLSTFFAGSNADTTSANNADKLLLQFLVSAVESLPNKDLWSQMILFALTSSCCLRSKPLGGGGAAEESSRKNGLKLDQITIIDQLQFKPSPKLIASSILRKEKQPTSSVQQSSMIHGDDADDLSNAIRLGDVIKPDIVILSIDETAKESSLNPLPSPPPSLSLSIADIKSSLCAKRSHKMQVAFYAMAIEHGFNEELRPVLREAASMLSTSASASSASPLLLNAITLLSGLTMNPNGEIWLPRDPRDLSAVDRSSAPSAEDLLSWRWGCVKSEAFSLENAKKDVKRFFSRFMPYVVYGCRTPRSDENNNVVTNPAHKNAVRSRQGREGGHEEGRGGRRWAADIEDIPYVIRSRCAQCDHLEVCQKSAINSGDAATLLGLPSPILARSAVDEGGGGGEDMGDADGDGGIMADVPTTVPNRLPPTSTRGPQPPWTLEAVIRAAGATDKEPSHLQTLAKATAEAIAAKSLFPLSPAFGLKERCETDGVMDKGGLNAVLQQGAFAVIRFESSITTPIRKDILNDNNDVPNAEGSKRGANDEVGLAKPSLQAPSFSSSPSHPSPFRKRSGGGGCGDGSVVAASPSLSPGQRVRVRGAVERPSAAQRAYSTTTTATAERTDYPFSNAAELIDILIGFKGDISHLAVYSSADHQQLLTALATVAHPTTSTSSSTFDAQGLDRSPTAHYPQRVQAASLLLRFADGVASRLIATACSDGLFDVDSNINGGRIICLVDTAKAYFALPIPRACLSGPTASRQLLALFDEQNGGGSENRTMDPSSVVGLDPATTKSAAAATADEGVVSPPPSLRVRHVRRLAELLKQHHRAAVPAFPSLSPFAEMICHGDFFDTLRVGRRNGLLGAETKAGEKNDEKEEDTEASRLLQRIVLLEQTAALALCAGAQRTLTSTMRDGEPCRRAPLRLSLHLSPSSKMTIENTLPSLLLPPDVKGSTPIECVRIEGSVDAAAQWLQLTDPAKFCDKLRLDFESSVTDFQNGSFVTLCNDWRPRVPSSPDNTSIHVFDHLASYTAHKSKIRTATTIDLRWVSAEELAAQSPGAEDRKERLSVILIPQRPSPTLTASHQKSITTNMSGSPILSEDGSKVLVFATYLRACDKYAPSFRYVISRTADFNAGPLLQCLSGRGGPTKTKSGPHPMLLRYLLDGRSRCASCAASSSAPPLLDSAAGNRRQQHRHRFSVASTHTVYDAKLTEDQSAFVHSTVADHTVSLLWGPPGTGKSHTLAVMLFKFLVRGLPQYEAAASMKHSSSPGGRGARAAVVKTPPPPFINILVVAFTKTALMEVLEKVELFALSLNSSPSSGSSVLKKKQVQYNNAWPQRITLGGSTVTFSTVWQAIKIDTFPQPFPSPSQQQAVCSDGVYDMLVIDEASQMRVSTALLASTCLQRGGDVPVRIVLAGDMLQLSPIVPATAAAAAWAMSPSDRPLLLGSILEASLFKRQTSAAEEEAAQASPPPKPSMRAERLLPEDLLLLHHHAEEKAVDTTSSGGEGDKTKTKPPLSPSRVFPPNLVQLSTTRRGQGRKLVDFVGHIYPRYEPAVTVAKEAVDRSSLHLIKLREDDDDDDNDADGGADDDGDCRESSSSSSLPTIARREVQCLEGIVRELFTDARKAPKSVGIVAPHRVQCVAARRAVAALLRSSKGAVRAELKPTSNEKGSAKGEQHTEGGGGGWNKNTSDNASFPASGPTAKRQSKATNPNSSGTVTTPTTRRTLPAAPPRRREDASSLPSAFPTRTADQDSRVPFETDASSFAPNAEFDGGDCDDDDDDGVSSPLNSESEEGRPCQIAIDTTERHQGAQFDVVIVLLANVSRRFVYNLNRLNVAFSRARESIFLVTTESVLNPTAEELQSMVGREKSCWGGGDGSSGGLAMTSLSLPSPPDSQQRREKYCEKDGIVEGREHRPSSSTERAVEYLQCFARVATLTELQ